MPNDTLAAQLQVSAVIPNYNGRHLLMQHLPAVVNCLRDGDQLVIVDDASTDDSVRWLIAQYHLVVAADKVWHGRYRTAQKNIEILLKQNLQNGRFGATANHGVAVATGAFILLLNSDVSPHADILKFLLPHFQNPLTFAVGCLEVEKRYGRVILGGRNTLHFQRGMFIHARANKLVTGTTAWVTGGSGLFDRAKWLAIGGFDHRFFPAYWEDIDLAWQARQRGWRVWFESQAIVDHNHESTNSDVFGTANMQTMSWINANKFVWKNGSFKQKLLHIVWQPYWLWKTRQGHQSEEI